MKLSQQTLASMLVIGSILAGVSACASTSDQNAPTNQQSVSQKTLWQIAEKRADLSTFVALVSKAGLDSELKQGTAAKTIFAPTNEAFNAVDAKTLKTLNDDPEALKAVLLYHVIPNSVMAQDIKSESVTTLNGAKVETGNAGGYATFGDGLVIEKDLKANNGVIHVIDRVLMPPKK